jgi:DNA-binding CsgD family transcriptional regulator
VPPIRLVGRQAECDALDRLLSEALAGRSGVMVLRGEPGVGKSALLGYLSDRTKGWHVATASGIESEMELAYSGLHQLCAPILDHLARLPVPQREALATVFGLGAGPAPDPFLVGLATLTLFATIADDQPLVTVVDDAQWLDQSSARILGFVARRLLAERIALVCAARTGSAEDFLTGLPEMPIGGLGDSDARALLLENMNGPLDAAVRDQIVAESHGNPLALLELPRTWSAVDLAGGYGLPTSHPIAGKIENSYMQRLLQLPRETQLLVLAAAAEPLGDPVLLHRAAETLGCDMAGAHAAVDAGLLELGRRVKFAHPLVRSATYHSAAADDRRRVHHALAEATNVSADPDRRAWHRAQATSEADEEIAAELEHSAIRAESRAGLAAAAAFLARAAELTPDPTQRVRRAVDAALANVQAGAIETARRLLTIARDGPIDELQRARIELVRSQLAFAASKGGDATPLLLTAARRLEAVDIRQARETYLDAFIAALLGTRLNDAVDVRDVAEAVRATSHRANRDPTAGDMLLEAFTALTYDYETAVPACRDVLRKLRDDERAAEPRPRWLWFATFIALELWDDESWYVLSDRHLQIASATGLLSDLPVVLTSRTFILVFCGELAAAGGLVDELRSLHETTGIGNPPFGGVVLGAWRGLANDASQLIESTIRDARARNEGIGVATSEYARALLYNATGQYEEALLAASRAVQDPRQVAAENWGLLELIESATQVGKTELATDAMNRLAVKAQAAGTDWALGIEARSRALLSEDDAEPFFRKAIAHLSHTRVRGELARAHLLYGEWLRRANRRVDARHELRSAYEMFSAMSMEGFVERTRQQLRAAGATVRPRSVETRDDLTPQEAHIARLARDGLSNPEIGAQLFISARTVEWHLGNVFTKLGISSRRELHTALPDAEQTGGA